MNGPALNTDRELYREDTGDSAGSHYENSLHVTAQGHIGMNVGGTVLTAPIAHWHTAARAAGVQEQLLGEVLSRAKALQRSNNPAVRRAGAELRELIQR